MRAEGCPSGVAVATVALAAIGTLIAVLRDAVLVVFSSDPAVRADVAGLLPLVLVVVLADGVQAVTGFGLTGLKRTTPSLVVFLTCYGLLAAGSVAVAEARGLTGLWTALAAANALLIAGQLAAFTRESRRHRAPPAAPAPIPSPPKV